MDEQKVVSMQLVSKDGETKLDLENQDEIDDLHNAICINLHINSKDKETTVSEAKLQIYEKFETGLSPIFESQGKQIMGFKLFLKGNFIEKDMTIAQLDSINHNDTIYASEGFGKPFVFKRFKDTNLSYGWCNSGNYPDGIAFKPTQNVKV